MRQITKIMADAFFKGETKSLSNTMVQNYEMYLFGNRIAWLYEGKLYFTLCGWNTQTTRERLAGLDIRISQKNGEPYWNGSKISDNAIYEMEV